MEGIRSSPSQSPPPTTATKTPDRKPETAAMSRMEKECLAFFVSLQESFRYVKAKFVGLAKKMTARNEKEATAADLQASKMEVEAADEAENIKKRIEKSL